MGNTNRRCYAQLCGLAQALDRVGERWTLLIVRNLLAGSARYGELLAELPGITTNLLAKRLKEMEATGLLERRDVPGSVRATAYALSELGLELEPALLALGAWGGRYLEPGDADLHRNLRWALVSLKRRLRPGRPSLRVRLDAETRSFWMELGDALKIDTVEAEADVDLVVSATEETLLAWLAGGAGTSELERSRRLTIEGRRRDVSTLRRRLRLRA